jgi:hypothetical protein
MPHSYVAQAMVLRKAVASAAITQQQNFNIEIGFWQVL